jgi:transcriptional regulator with XRE-family HTH domain
MSYNIFDELIQDKERFASDTAQSAALIEAANLIAEALRGQGLKQKELAAKLAVSEGYISRLLSGDENLTVRTMARVLHSLGQKYVQRSIPQEGATVVTLQPQAVRFTTYNALNSLIPVEVRCGENQSEAS